jgi:hypothetical protein
MNRPCLLDFESLVWDKAAFQHSKRKYYILLESLPRLFKRLRNTNTVMAFSPRLMAETWESFPLAEMNPDLPDYESIRDFYSAVLEFMSAARFDKFCL